MSTLQSDLPPTPWNTIEDIIIKELGKPIHEIFISIDKSPIGAASIGQVHRAVLLDGTPVVVKVMYPEVEDMFKVSYQSIPSFYPFFLSYLFILSFYPIILSHLFIYLHTFISILIIHNL